MVRVRDALDRVDAEDAGQLYLAAVAGMLGAEMAKRRGDHQALVNGLALTFFAIAGILGILREQAEDYIPPQAG